jgi:hypothetical protein
MEGSDTVELALDLACQDPVGEFGSDCPQFGQVGHRFRMIVGEDALEPLWWGRLLWVVARPRRIVPQQFILGEHSGGINAEAVDAAPEPESHDIGHGGAHVGVPPVQIGLLAQEGMVIILASVAVPLPRPAAEPTEPLVRRPPSCARPRAQWCACWGEVLAATACVSMTYRNLVRSISRRALWRRISFAGSSAEPFGYRSVCNRGDPSTERQMRYFFAGPGLAIMLLATGSVSAQQGQQATDDQKSFSQSVKALPSTPKRRNIIRAERSTMTNRAPRSTVGVSPAR